MHPNPLLIGYGRTSDKEVFTKLGAYLEGQGDLVSRLGCRV